jgi:integrase
VCRPVHRGEAHRSGWRSSVHAAQWTATLRDQAAPLRRLPVASITTEDVLSVLKPIWTATPETASRLRGRIERVLDNAKAKGLRTGENPARWRGHLDQLLAKRPRLAKVHFSAMAYADIPAFVERLRVRQSMAALALEFAILTASRPGEVLGARREEFDLNDALWTVSGARMKGGRQHQVPLSPRAVEIVQEAMLLGEGLVFPGRKRGQPMAPGVFTEMMRRMKVTVTAHGFRSSFRDWVGDTTAFSRDVVESALAHAIANPTEAAYRRGSAIEKRRSLMNVWADYCAGKTLGKIIRGQFG